MIHLDPSWLQHVEKPARYTGGEWNSIVKDHSTVDVTMALAFPDVYEVSMSHLGIKILYGLLNERQDVVAERVFALGTTWKRKCETVRFLYFLWKPKRQFANLIYWDLHCNMK